MANEDETKTGTEDGGTEQKPAEGEAAKTGTEGQPKPAAEGQGGGEGEVEDKHGQPGSLITSQIDTAPKPSVGR